MNIWEAWQGLWQVAGPGGRALLAFMAGAMIGSFVNVCAIRIPEKRNIWISKSLCPICQHPIRPWHNWPVVGWLMLRGKCYDCKAPISPRYVLVEIIVGLGFMVIELLRGLNIRSLVLAAGYAVAVCLFLIFGRPKKKASGDKQDET